MLVQCGLPVRCCNHQRTARREQRIGAETRWGRLQESTAGLRECAHLRGAVAFHKERCGTSSRVISRLWLTLQDCGAPMRCEPVGNRRAGDACTDNQVVGFDGGRVGCHDPRGAIGAEAGMDSVRWLPFTRSKSISKFYVYEKNRRFQGNHVDGWLPKSMHFFVHAKFYQPPQPFDL